MKALVTGGAGFIGSHIVDRLIEQDWDVTVIDNESSDAHDNFYWNDAATNLQVDVADYELTREFYNDVDVVFHLAAQSRIQPAVNDPIEAARTNALGTQVALQCALEGGAMRFVFSSSSSVYGRNIGPHAEYMPTDCLNQYSASKLYGELLCKTYTRLHGLGTVPLRYFNVYGPRQPLRGAYAPVVGLFMRQHRNGEPMTIVGDGLQRRDFTHVDDVVRANLSAAWTIIQTKHFGRPINIGTGHNHSVFEVAQMVAGNKKPHVLFMPERPGEARETLAINTLAQDIFDWRPRRRLEDFIGELRGTSVCA